jgi:hypothetical protein
MMTLDEFATKIRENDDIVVYRRGNKYGRAFGFPQPCGIWTRYTPTCPRTTSSEKVRIEAEEAIRRHEASYKKAAEHRPHFIQSFEQRVSFIGLITQNVI